MVGCLRGAFAIGVGAALVAPVAVAVVLVVVIRGFLFRIERLGVRLMGEEEGVERRSSGSGLKETRCARVVVVLGFFAFGILERDAR